MGEIFRLWGRFLFFRARREDYDQIGWPHFAAGWICVWIVGIGRWWDDSSAVFPKTSGVGSAIYVFVLAGFFFTLLTLLCKVRYRQVLSVVCLTAPPAAIYAFPIEQFGSGTASTTYNLVSLALVSVYRVALILHYFKHGLGLGWVARWGVLLTLIGMILVPAGFLGFLNAIANSMGGFRPDRNPAREEFLGYLVFFAMVAGVIFLPVGMGMYFNQVLKLRRRNVNLVLRPAMESDIEWTHKTKRDSFREYVDQIWGWDEEAQYARHKERFTRQRIRVIQWVGAEVGFLATEEFPDFIQLNQLFLRPEFQKRGIGGHTVRELIAESDRPIRLQVLKVNPRAHAFYARLGFRNIGETEHHIQMEREAVNEAGPDTSRG